MISEQTLSFEETDSSGVLSNEENKRSNDTKEKSSMSSTVRVVKDKHSEGLARSATTKALENNTKKYLNS